MCRVIRPSPFVAGYPRLQVFAVPSTLFPGYPEVAVKYIRPPHTPAAAGGVAATASYAVARKRVVTRKRADTNFKREVHLLVRKRRLGSWCELCT